MRMPTIWFWIVQVSPKDLSIKYCTEGSACRIENIRLDRLKTWLSFDKIEVDIEEDGGVSQISNGIKSPL